MQAKKIGCKIVEPQEIFRVPADAFAPCALGGILNAATVEQLQSPIICGGANNQLESEEIGDLLIGRGVLYCPDFLANSGGIIDLHYQLNRVDRNLLPAHLERVADKLFKISDIAITRTESAQVIAEEMAEIRVRSAGKERTFA